MLNYTGVKKNSGYILYIDLVDQSNTKLFKVNPTIAAGDFKVSTDGAAYADLATLPVVTPAGGRSVKITLSAGEINGDNILVQCVDAAGAEWCDEAINIQTTPVDASIVQIDGTANASATLNLTKLNIINSAGDAIVAQSTGGNGHGIHTIGAGTGSGLFGTSTGTGNGIFGAAGTTGAGIVGQGGSTSGAGFLGYAIAGDSAGIACAGFGGGAGLYANGGVTGHGINGVGGATSGTGMYTTAVGSGDGFRALGTGNGKGFYAIGTGTGAGITAQAGTFGPGFNCIGGATGGSGLRAEAVGNGAGFNCIGVANASILATQGISGPLDTATYNAITDNALLRDFTAVSSGGAASYCLLNALRTLRNWSVSGSTYTAYAEDGTTPVLTVTLTTDATALAVVRFDSN